MRILGLAYLSGTVFRGSGFAHRVDGLATRNRVVDFPPMDRHLLGGLHAESHLVTTDFDHHDRDVVIDDDAFVFFSRENQHPTFLGDLGALDTQNSLKTPLTI